MLLHQTNYVNQLAETFRYVVLSLDKSQHPGHYTHGVGDQEAQVGRAIDERVIIVFI